MTSSAVPGDGFSLSSSCKLVLKVRGERKMGFSLEAIAVIPLCISILAQSTALSEPAARDLKTTACLTAQAARETGQVTDCCLHLSYKSGNSSIPGVETRPQKLVEAMSMAGDLLGLLKGGESGSPDIRP